MASYASGGPIIWGQLCEVVRQFFLVVAIEKLMTGDGARSLGIQATRMKPGLLHSARRERFFFGKGVVSSVQTAPSPPCSSNGFRNIHQLCPKNKHGSAWVGRH